MGTLVLHTSSSAPNHSNTSMMTRVYNDDSFGYSQELLARKSNVAELNIHIEITTT
jgi:hypothetical protein